MTKIRNYLSCAATLSVVLHSAGAAAAEPAAGAQAPGAATELQAVPAADTVQPTSPDANAQGSAPSTPSEHGSSIGLLGTPAFNIGVSGFIRPEVAVSTSGEKSNFFNQRGNLFNGRAVTRDTGDVAIRNGQAARGDINLAILRGRLEIETKFTSNLSLTAKVTGIYDPAIYHEYNPASVNSQAVGVLYQKPNQFKYDAEGTHNPNPLERSGRNYLISLPALFLDYNVGPFDLRVGNQQIAWGQAIFFRVLDVPDGLDLRRHSVLDFASEEFSDKRVPALAIRTSYQFSESWLGEAYFQKFQPTVLGNPNTQYNLIPAGFTVHDRYTDFDNKYSYGLRLKGTIGPVGVQGIAVRRYNPDGVYRWTKSGVNRDIPGLPGSGAVLQDTAFEVDPTGVWSADEWFTYAAASRLNGVTGLNTSISEFPAAGLLGATVVPTPNGPQSGYAAAHKELDTFFALAGGLAAGTPGQGGLRGHIAREYKQETDLGGGLSYVIDSTPGSLLDQLIINVEALYVPNRTFTAPSLTQNFLVKSEWTTALVMEKYQRFFSAIPATYIVAQWLHKSESDLFGRALEGQGGNQTTVAPGLKGGYNAAVLAFQQPFPQLIWRADFAALYDFKGGLLIQPAVRWKPSGNITVDLFYNYLNGHLASPNKNIVSTVDYADELALRVGYQF